MVKDYYKVLGLSRGASKDEMKKAYRELSKKHHPDRNKGDKASEEKFKEINEAYSALTKTPNRGSINGEDIFSNMGFDFFNMNQARRQTRPNRHTQIKGRDIKFVKDVPLVHFITGGKISFGLVITDLCVDCNGTGNIEWKTCPSCNGQGARTESGRRGNMIFSQTVNCNVCRGLGEVGVKKCDGCGGDGKKDVKRSFTIHIPKNSKDGYVDKQLENGFTGRNGGPNGDLYIKARMKLPKIGDLTEEQINLLKEISCDKESLEF